MCNNCWSTSPKSTISGPLGQSNLLELLRRKSPAVQMKSRMYVQTKAVRHFTEQEEGGRYMAVIPKALQFVQTGKQIGELVESSLHTYKVPRDGSVRQNAKEFDINK